MKFLAAALIVALSTSAFAQSLTPILMSNGEAKIVCDGQSRWMNNVRLVNKHIVKVYLFGNLVTAPGYGADVVIWSEAYGQLHPLSKWGTIGDLHMFPHTLGGGRQGEMDRTFPGDGIYIPDNEVFLNVVCWGGGTLELYAQIWVK